MTAANTSFEKYIQSIPEGLSEVKQLILKTLWNEGKDFPKNWVRSSILLNLTKQKYFDRRIRELRDQCGCDIETEYHDGDHCYRLNSPYLNNYNPRLYLSQSIKEKLFEKFNYRCNVCKRQLSSGVIGLQADHREPLSRKELLKQDVNNLIYWQPICNECNVIKRRVCAECNNNCQECPWAYPEQHGKSIFINIPTELEQEMIRRGIFDQNQIQKFILDAIKNNLKKKI